MKKSNLMKVVLLPLLLMSVASCKNGNNNNSENSSSKNEESDSFVFTQQMDEYGILPEDVVNAKIEIDLVEYIEGQNGTIEDIGNYSPVLNDDGIPYDPETGELRKYGPDDIPFIDLAKYVGAAQEFKKYAPNVEFNVIYCSINEYNSIIRAYKDQYGHLPHIMHPTDQIVEMIEQGYAVDCSMYSDAAYYESYNEFFMSRFNYGGFQGAIPLQVQPWGLFVNTDDLTEYFVLNSVYDEETHENTDEYKEWVDNFTWESFIDAVKKTTDDTHAGLSKVYEKLASTSAANIYNQYIQEGTVDFTSSEITQSMKQLLEWENELAADSQYTVYLYDETSVGKTPNSNKFPNAHNWSGVANFVEDQYSTFFAEAPWAVPTISQYIEEHNLRDAINVDVLPYPKMSEDAPAFSGVGVGGLVIGNQTPIDGISGSPTFKGYSSMEDALLHQKVAAYFSMFMNADPRAIESRSHIKYLYNDVYYTGDITLPLTKKEFRYAWQSDPELAANDPSQAYEDNWQYQLALYLQLYDVYLTNDQPADVEDFTNVAYGLASMLDCIYGDEVTAINYANEPVNIYLDGEVVDIFERWDTRHEYFIDSESLTGTLGTSTYVDQVLSHLAELEDYINDNTEKVWLDLQDNIDMFYGSDKYNVLDRSYRNDYEGSIIE